MKTTLSPKEVALAIGVSESSVKRWVDEGVIGATKTLGGHRRISLAEVSRFVRESRMSVARPDILGLTDLEAVPVDQAVRQGPAQILQEALLAGRASEARGIIVSLYLGGRSAAEIWDQVISPALRHVGTLWQHAASGIYVEHRATDIVGQAINQLRILLPQASPQASLGIGGAPSGDPYLLPSLMAATVVAVTGFRDVNLGAETPLEILAEAAERFHAKLVWLAVSVERPAEALAAQTDQLARQLGEHGAYLVVGGRAVPAGFAARRPNIHVARTMAELEALAKGILAGG